MISSNKRTNALIWTGIGAAAAGIIAAVTIYRLREHEQDKSTQHYRDFNAVLDDCYRKISEIEEHLPTQVQAVARQQHSIENSVANN